MSDIVKRYGETLGSLSGQHPLAARRLLVAGLWMFGLKLKYRANPALPKSRQDLAVLLNEQVIGMLAKPKQAALVSVFTPCEILHAASVHPLCAELYSAFLNGAHAERAFAEAAEAEGIAETYCSYHKVLLGSAFSGVMPKPSFIVNTSLVCDANNLTFRTLADHYGIEQYYIDVPPKADRDAVLYVADQLQELKTFVEEQTHKKISDEMLSELVARSGRTIRNLMQATDKKSTRWLPGDIASELYEIFISHISLGSKEAEDYSVQLLKDLDKAPTSGGLRILWIHTIPNWQTPIREVFNLSDRAMIISCDLNYDSYLEMDPSKPYESMARRLVESTYNGSGSRRIEAALDMAKKEHADGVVVFCHWGCKQTMGLSARFQKELEEAGFPTLVLNGDGCDERNASDGQTATRLNAFLEMLETRHE